MSLRTLTIHTLLFLLVSLPAVTFAGPNNNVASKSACQKDTVKAQFETPLGSLTLKDDEDDRSNRYICLNDKLLAQTRPISDGGYYRFTSPMLGYGIHDIDSPGEALRPLHRIVVQENTSLDCDNKYWLLDFRGKEPLVVGPFGEHDCSERFYVLWSNETVAVAAYVEKDDILTPGPRYPEKDENGEELYTRDSHTGALIPLYNSTGKFNPDSVSHEGYVYSYKTNKVIKAIVDD